MSTQIQTANEHRVFVDLDGYDRIRAHSPERINQKNEMNIAENVRRFAMSGRAALSERIDELDREWDIDRAVLLFASFAISTVALLGLRRNRKWFGLLAVQMPFLAYHAAKGWCPPASLFRRLGFRTTKEIDAEKYALKTLRGDFAR